MDKLNSYNFTTLLNKYERPDKIRKKKTMLEQYFFNQSHQD